MAKLIGRLPTSRSLSRQVECLGDLQGPKFRVGELAGDPVELKNGEVFEPLGAFVLGTGSGRFGISVDDNDNIRPGRITMKCLRV